MYKKRLTTMSTEISGLTTHLGYSAAKVSLEQPNTGVRQTAKAEEPADNKATNKLTTATPTEVGALVAETRQQQAQQKAEETDKQPETISASELKSILDEINSALYSYNRSLKFELYDETEDLVVKVLNTKTDEVIRQYPSEEVLERRTKLMDGDTNFFSTEVS